MCYYSGINLFWRNKMSVLYFLEGIRTPVLDRFFSLVTHLGSETLFIVIAIAVFWCVNKRTGYYLLTVGFFGTLLNQFLKLTCQIPRPWVRDPNFTIVEAARADATGYSFPSGHTQSITGSMGCLARSSKKGWVRLVCILLIAQHHVAALYQRRHNLRGCLAIFPEVLAIVDVARYRYTHSVCHFACFQTYLGRRSADGGGDTREVEPVGTLEYAFPVDHAHLDG
jgi:hypothetical protein